MLRAFPCVISRTGYTGEDGFELYLSPLPKPPACGSFCWPKARPGLIPAASWLPRHPCGWSPMPLYGHDDDRRCHPAGGGLGSFVKLEKPAFIGRGALLAQGEAPRVRVGLRVNGRGIVREACPSFPAAVRWAFPPRAPTAPIWASPGNGSGGAGLSAPGTALEPRCGAARGGRDRIPLCPFDRARGLTPPEHNKNWRKTV